MYCNLSSLLRSSLSSRRLCSSGGDEGKEKESEKGRGTPKHEKDTAAASALSHGHSGDDDDEVDAEDEVDAAAEGGELNQIQTALRVEVLNIYGRAARAGARNLSYSYQTKSLQLINSITFD